MELFKDIMRLVRWSNLLFLGALVWVMEKWVAVPILNAAAYGEQMPWYILLLLEIAVILIAAGGYVINDYFDVKIDRINRPDAVIVTRTISKPAAMRLSICLSAAGAACGILEAILLRSMTIGILFVIVPGLLWFYSSSYKRLFMIGNLTIALLAAVTPMLVAMTNVAILQLRFETILPYISLPHDLYAWLGGFALFAFLLTWIREIIKDMQDQMGDRELECHSMPVVWGDLWTKVFVTALIVLTLAIIGHIWYHLLPFPIGWTSLSTRYIALGIVVPLLSAIWLLWSAKIPSDYKSCQQVIKFAMLIGMLYGYVIMRLYV
ncbi:MAG: geranylgeranylglycerol-phosphate geranylgeranyltransferase [Paludibacteraceae bacterium]|nr:geranylgeranylglycerol-phosphate geranylgeranyltransferase [Paludibacteraceae bacterium]MBR1381092.1 geranylgeranylglycerol-phosphate geranylgeranyltransferase [Paludibacteraceae bacterium]